MQKEPKKLILASASPRRQALMTSLGVPFSVLIPKDFEEIQDHSGSAHDLVRLNAEGKARTVAAQVKEGIVIGVDTVGALDDHILEKPKDEADAYRMLKMLQGKTHEVLTAICVIDVESGHEASLLQSTEIEFHPMSDSEISAYIATGEPMDKAAAYAAQGIGALFIKEIRGDFFNVVGLPLSSLRFLLKEFDIDLLDWVK